MSEDLLSLAEQALKLHKENQGKIEVKTKVPIHDVNDLSLAYSPGVAEPCKEIAQDTRKVFDYTMKGNNIAIVTNGTAVLGLGDIGPEAALPVMEGKSALIKAFANIDAFPICLNTTDIDKFVEIVKMMEPTFGGIILEDIAAPACFEIEKRLSEEMKIPVFHDDQHGTAIVTLAGLINALKVVNKHMDRIRVVINGAGSAGIAIAKLLLHAGVRDVILCDSKGAIFEGRTYGMNRTKDEIATVTNQSKLEGSLAEIIPGSDVFIGVSVEGALTKSMIQSMNEDPIIFAMANPNPEIMPAEAKMAGAKIIGTGRSDLPNQVNNVLAYPGLFRGVLNAKAKTITDEMKVTAAYAIAEVIKDNELSSDYIIPNPFDSRVVPSVSEAIFNLVKEN